jgi:hypothetical protein
VTCTGHRAGTSWCVVLGRGLLPPLLVPSPLVWIVGFPETSGQLPTSFGCGGRTSAQKRHPHRRSTDLPKGKAVEPFVEPPRCRGSPMSPKTNQRSTSKNRIEQAFHCDPSPEASQRLSVLESSRGPDQARRGVVRALETTT